jgi:hypothetical protein
VSFLGERLAVTCTLAVIHIKLGEPSLFLRLGREGHRLKQNEWGLPGSFSWQSFFGLGCVFHAAATSRRRPRIVGYVDADDREPAFKQWLASLSSLTDSAEAANHWRNRRYSFAYRLGEELAGPTSTHPAVIGPAVYGIWFNWGLLYASSRECQGSAEVGVKHQPKHCQPSTEAEMSHISRRNTTKSAPGSVVFQDIGMGCLKTSE